MLSPSLFRFLRSDPTSTVDRFASRRRSRAIATAALPRRCRRCCAGRPGCPSPSPCDVEPVLHGRRAGPGLAGEPIDERRETRDENMRRNDSAVDAAASASVRAAGSNARMSSQRRGWASLANIRSWACARGSAGRTDRGSGRTSPRSDRGPGARRLPTRGPGHRDHVPCRAAAAHAAWSPASPLARMWQWPPCRKTRDSRLLGGDPGRRSRRHGSPVEVRHDNPR